MPIGPPVNGSAEGVRVTRRAATAAGGTCTFWTRSPSTAVVGTLVTLSPSTVALAPAPALCEQLDTQPGVDEQLVVQLGVDEQLVVQPGVDEQLVVQLGEQPAAVGWVTQSLPLLGVVHPVCAGLVRPMPLLLSHS